MNIESVYDDWSRKQPHLYRADVPEAEIDGIQFGLLSADEIKQRSVIEVDMTGRSNGMIVKQGGVTDTRLGTSNRDIICGTCCNEYTECTTGHSGYIRLAIPIPNAELMSMKTLTNLTKILNCFCYRCSRLILSRDFVNFQDIVNKTDDSTRLKRVVDAAKRRRICANYEQHGSKVDIREAMEQMKQSDKELENVSFKDILKRRATHGCMAVQPVWERHNTTLLHAVFPYSPAPSLSYIDVARILDNISDEDCLLLGIDPEHAHPRHMMWRIFPIPPIVIRQSQTVRKGNRRMAGYHDLTDSLNKIVSANAKLKLLLKDRDISEYSTIFNISKSSSGAITFEEPTSNSDHTSSTSASAFASTPEYKSAPVGQKRKRNRVGTDKPQAKRKKKVASASASASEHKSDYKSASVGQKRKRNGAGTDKPQAKRKKKVIISDEMKLFYKVNDGIFAYQNSTLKNAEKNRHGSKEKKSIRDVFAGQNENIMRRLVTGKRMNFTARTVAVPYFSKMHINEVGVPLEMCKKITYPERVTPYNIHRLTELVRRGPSQYPGARYVFDEKRKEGKGINLDIKSQRDNLELRYGMVVERHLIKHDIVLLNRQPSLHRFSIMAHRVVPVEGKTLRVHLAVTPAYNLDFDGDEVNMIVPQEEEARAEAAHLLLVDHNLMKGSKPLIKFVQNAVVAAYNLTRPNDRFTYKQVCQMILPLYEYDWPDKFLHNPTKLYSGHEIFSLALPDDFNLSVGSVRIQNGQMMEGQWDSKTLNGSRGLLRHYHQMYGGPKTADFITVICQLLDIYLTRFCPVTVSMNDVYQPETQSMVQSLKRNLSVLPETPSTTEEGTETYEKNMCNIMDRVRGVVSGKVEEISQKHDQNGFRDLVISGAKGNINNLCQVAGSIGQQYDPHAQRFTESTSHRVSSSEKHGMIYNSFTDGMTVLNMFYHFCASRNGLMGTGVKTSATGYAHRKFSKFLENLHADAYQGIINSHDELVQMLYGGDGFDPKHLMATTLPSFFLKKDYWKWTEDFTRSEIQPLYAFKCQMDLYPRVHNYKHILTFWSPVSIPNLLHYITQQDEKLDGSTIEPPANAYEIKEWREQLFHDLQSVLKYRKRFYIYLCLELSTLKLLQWPATSERLDILKEAIMDSIEYAYVDMGENIGLHAAQSMGEQMTQTSLNEFHKSGRRSALNSGVDRLTEITKNTKRAKTPSMIIYLNSAWAWDRVLVEEKANSLVHRDVSEIIHSVVPVIHEEEGEEEGKVETKTKSRSKKGKYDNYIYGEIVLHNNSHRSVLASMIDNQLRLKTRQDFKCGSFEWIDRDQCIFRVARNDPDITKWAKQAQLLKDIYYDPTTGKSRPTSTIVHVPELVYDLLSEQLCKLKWKGVDRIEYVDVEPVQDGEYCIVTRGSNMQHILGLPWVDVTRTITNDIAEMNQAFGIDAAAKSIEVELNAVLNSSGGCVENRHLQLLSANMTYMGYITSLGLKGLNARAKSTLRVCSFENCLPRFYQGAQKGEYDHCAGVAERLITGKRMVAGTGSVNIIQDKHAKPVDNSEVLNQRVCNLELPSLEALQALTTESITPIVEEERSSSSSSSSPSPSPVSQQARHFESSCSIM
jgi:DNA-directed RNA polymerase beta' subunit